MTPTTWYLDAEGLYHRLGTEDGDKFRTDDDDTVVACGSEAGRDAPETAPPIELRCCWCELPMSARLERAAHEWLEGTLLDVGLPTTSTRPCTTVYRPCRLSSPKCSGLRDMQS